MAFAYKDTISVTGSSSLLPSTQTDFPVLVSITNNVLKTVANGGQVQNASGYDIVFYSDSALTSILNFEIESYDGTAGTIVIWVKISSLSLGLVFYAGIGDASIVTFQGNVNGTWNSAYKCVWHLGDGTTLNAVDSTSNGNSGTNTNETAATGQISGGAYLNNGNPSKIEKASAAGLPVNKTDPFTFQAWTKCHAYVFHSCIFGFGSQMTGSGVGTKRAILQNNNHYYLWGDNADWDPAIADDHDNAWHHWAFTSTGTVLAFYRDGVQRATQTGLPASWTTAGTYITGGSGLTAAISADATLDEARISNVARSADWITAEYNNQANPGTFLSHSFAVIGGTAAPALQPITANASETETFTGPCAAELVALSGDAAGSFTAQSSGGRARRSNWDRSFSAIPPPPEIPTEELAIGGNIVSILRPVGCSAFGGVGYAGSAAALVAPLRGHAVGEFSDPEGEDEELLMLMGVL